MQLKNRETTIICPSEARPTQVLAAREVQRYVYLRSGQLLPISDKSIEGQDSILLAQDTSLGAEQYRFQTSQSAGAKTLTITGGSDLATLYGVYHFIEKLGVRFYLHGDVIPDEQIPFVVPDLDETHAPLFEARGLNVYHDFPCGPDWWSMDDYKTYFAQMTKLRMNVITLHNYQETTHEGAVVVGEPLVWVGLPEDVNPDGTVRSSYVSILASLSGGSQHFGLRPVRSSEMAAGAGRVFAGDDFGSPITEGYRPVPKTPGECNAVFNRAGRFLNEAITYAHGLGIKVGLGIDIYMPLPVNLTVKARLKELGLDWNDHAVTNRLFEGIFTRIKRTHPLDHFVLYAPEMWTYRGERPEEVKVTLQGIHAAWQVLEAMGKPFQLATLGWSLGPIRDLLAYDRIFSKEVVMASINEWAGFKAVEPAYAGIKGRPRWAIPWIEDDGVMATPQLWAGRLRRDAADAHAYGCTGLLGVLWRTKVLSPNISALAQAGWEQKSWNPNFGKCLDRWIREEDVRVGGNRAEFACPAQVPIYHSGCVGMSAYRLRVPFGDYKVTLKFIEPVCDQPGRRVFTVKVQGQTVAQDLDLFAQAGKNTAFDLTINDVKSDYSQKFLIEFEKQVGEPLICGIEIAGQVTGTNQFSGEGWVHRINCGGEAWQDFEADMPVEVEPPLGRDRLRDLPATDLYRDMAQAWFGPEVADAAGSMLAQLDGSRSQVLGVLRNANLPRPGNWNGGVGGILIYRAEDRPISPKDYRLAYATVQEREETRAQFGFVEEFAALRPRVKGAGNLERFDYWLHTFRYLREMFEIGCARGRQELAMEKLATASPSEKPALAQAALQIRLELARLWERMITELLQTVSTPGELGTVALLEQQPRRNPRPKGMLLLNAHDAALTEALGHALPPEAEPSTTYTGPVRLFAPTVRPSAAPGEVVIVPLVVLDERDPKSVWLYYRPLGQGEFRKIAVQHVGRGVHRATLPPADGTTTEYYFEVETANSDILRWPITAPRINQTVVTV